MKGMCLTLSKQRACGMNLLKMFILQIQMGICRARLTNCPGALTNVFNCAFVTLEYYLFTYCSMFMIEFVCFSTLQCIPGVWRWTVWFNVFEDEARNVQSRCVQLCWCIVFHVNGLTWVFTCPVLNTVMRLLRDTWKNWTENNCMFEMLALIWDITLAYGIRTNWDIGTSNWSNWVGGWVVINNAISMHGNSREFKTFSENNYFSMLF